LRNSRSGYIVFVVFKYRNIRIGLIAFALGFASVWGSDAYRLGVREARVKVPERNSRVELPETESRRVSRTLENDRIEIFPIRFRRGDGPDAPIMIRWTCDDSPTNPCDDDTSND
jgi:hypothetical protein